MPDAGAFGIGYLMIQEIISLNPLTPRTDIFLFRIALHLQYLLNILLINK
jgi:hypothetical protein